ncbi:hypothetical protein D3C73_1189970 [compost metagenome]
MRHVLANARESISSTLREHTITERKYTMHSVRLPVMVAQRPGGPVYPAVYAGTFVRFVEREAHKVVGACRFADHHQPDFVLRVVDEGVTDAGAGGKRNGVAFGDGMKHAVDPDIRLALKHEDEFLLGAFGVRI